VQATADTAFSTRTSLMLAENSSLNAEQPANWTVAVDGDTAVIKTDKLLVKVTLSQGTITFCKADGLLILREKATRSKIFTAAEVMGEPTYHVQQFFESPADEAFYGLGQHQNGVMTYKGHDVDLWQYNIVAAVPFLVSSRHYGILWIIIPAPSLAIFVITIRSPG
jgi:alpha-D-xyloside xylohydrolase